MRKLQCFLLIIASHIPLLAVSRNDIDAIFSQLKSASAPGAAVLVMKDGRAVLSEGYGLADLELRQKITPATNFRLASLTKQFTATACMLLVQDGKLHYEDRLTSIFPNFPVYGREITIRQLLTHTSGLKDYEDLLADKYKSVPEERIPQITDAGVLELLKSQTATKFEPGTRWEYSNSGYAVLAMVVEKVSGRAFGDFLRERIFLPLKMSGTVAFEAKKNEVANRAFGHTLVDGRWRQTDQSSTSAVLGDGGIYSSLNDLARWDHALDENVLIHPENMQQAMTPAPVSNPPSVEYGFGWFLDRYRGQARMHHYGETIGFRNAIQRFPQRKLTIIVLSNRADTNATALALKVADLYISSKQ